jgi:hypothetical protein
MMMKKYLMLLMVAAISHNSLAVQTEEERALSVMLSDAVVQVTTSLPMTLDEDTRLDSVSTVRNFMVYNNTMVNYDAAQLDASNFASALEDIILVPLCANPQLKGFIDQKVVMVYRYFGKDGKFITEISKDMSSC